MFSQLPPYPLGQTSQSNYLLFPIFTHHLIPQTTDYSPTTQQSTRPNSEAQQILDEMNATMIKLKGGNFNLLDELSKIRRCFKKN